MANALLSNLTLPQLKRVVEIKEQIESLEKEINQLLGTPVERVTESRKPQRRRRRFSRAARAKLAAAQRARRAREQAASGPVNGHPARRTKRKKFSAAARARISAAAKARWAKAKAAGKTRL